MQLSFISHSTPAAVFLFLLFSKLKFLKSWSLFLKRKGRDEQGVTDESPRICLSSLVGPVQDISTRTSLDAEEFSATLPVPRTSHTPSPSLSLDSTLPEGAGAQAGFCFPDCAYSNSFLTSKHVESFMLNIFKFWF